MHPTSDSVRELASEEETNSLNQGRRRRHDIFMAYFKADGGFLLNAPQGLPVDSFDDDVFERVSSGSDAFTTQKTSLSSSSSANLTASPMASSLASSTSPTDRQWSVEETRRYAAEVLAPEFQVDSD